MARNLTVYSQAPIGAAYVEDWYVASIIRMDSVPIVERRWENASTRAQVAYRLDTPSCPLMLVRTLKLGCFLEEWGLRETSPP